MLVSWDPEDKCVAATHDRERNRELDQSEINGERASDTFLRL